MTDGRTDEAWTDRREGGNSGLDGNGSFNETGSSFKRYISYFKHFKFVIMLLGLTLLALLNAKVSADSLFSDPISHENIWEGSQVYIYKKALFQDRLGMEEGNQ